ncbi:MAG: hypothetical protein M1822_002604 [Bathelium mastoideum]|nr:MAG: hypothetical protein M1822_002604 [Bathelium mastoideum]
MAGYSWEDDIYGNCVSDVSAGQILTYASPSFDSATDPSDWASATTTLDFDSVIVAMAVVGWNVKYTTTSPTSRAANPVSAASAGTTTSSSAISPSTNTTSPPPDGLSSGAKAGIGIGVAVGVIGLLALLGAIFLLRRKSKTQTLSREGNNNRWTRHELPAMERQPAELSEGGTTHPLGGYYKSNSTRDEPPVELAAHERPQEMDTDHE